MVGPLRPERWIGDDRCEFGHGFREPCEVGFRATQAGNPWEGLLQCFGRIEELAVAPEPPGHLQAEWHAMPIGAAGQRHGRIGHERDEVGERESVVVVAKLRSLERLQGELRPGKRRDRNRG